MVYYVYIYIHTYISLSETLKSISQNVRQLIMFDLVYFYSFGIWFYVELDIHSVALTVLVLYGHWSV